MTLQRLYHCSSDQIYFSFFFFFLVCIGGMPKFPCQGSNQSHFSDNAGSLTQSTPGELLFFIHSFFFFLRSWTFRSFITQHWVTNIGVFLHAAQTLNLCFWSVAYGLLFFNIMIFIFFNIIAGLQCSVNFLLYSKVTQLHIHVYILLSHIIRLHHKWLDTVPSVFFILNKGEAKL